MSKELTAFDELKASVTVYVAPTLHIAVTNFQTSAIAIDAGKKVKSLRDAIEKKRKELVGPLNDQVKQINEYAKLIAEPLLSAENHLKRQLLIFEQEQEKIRIAERQKLEEERQAALAKLEEETKVEAKASGFFGAEEESLPLEQTPEVRRAVLEGEFQGKAWDIHDARVKNTRKTWKCEVIDASLLPREFLMPNEKAIKAAVTNGRTQIPGVRAWQEANISFGQKTSISRSVLEKEAAE